MEIRKCHYCGKEYPESYFGIALTTPQKVYKRHKCRFCYRKTKNNLRRKYADWIMRYKEKKGCNKCGISDPRVLEFHHKNDKKFAIAEIVRMKYGKKRLEEEVKKCDVLCANCHRILHFEERGKTV